MYKSKLQELCHRKHWQMPDYKTAKDGPPHNPRFLTTVSVNDLSFSNHQSFKTIKDSQNDVAKLAFLHLTSSPSSVSVGSSSSSTMQLNMQEPNQTPQVNATPLFCAAAAVVKDSNESKDQILFMPNLYKNQLQSYAQKRNLPLPTYSCEREGPPHASRFRCKVTIDEQTYECPTFFPTLKEAEHGAAKVALTSLSSDGAQEVDSVLYKNLLQELAQKEYSALPIYKTHQSGEPHVPTFVSTVEVKGEVFTGQEARTKKQAEMSAGKVAYITLKERSVKQSQSPASLSPAGGAQADHPSSYSPSNVAANLHQDIQATGRMVFSPARSEQAEEDHEVTEEADQHLQNMFPQPEINSTWKRESSPTVLSVPSVAANCPASPSSPSDVSGANAPTKIRILPSMPNVNIPKGSSLLRRDERFVALKLSSPSNQ